MKALQESFGKDLWEMLAGQSFDIKKIKDHLEKMGN